MGKIRIARHTTGPRWMEYIEAEVRAVCHNKGWHHQIRRKWSSRDQPVKTCSVQDYEWKLIPAPDPSATNEIPRDEAGSAFEEGIYFVLGITEGALVLQHDTIHAGIEDDHRLMSTYTKIDLEPTGMIALRHRMAETGSPEPDLALPYPPPPSGTLERFLQDLTTRFRPNHFSIT